MIDGIGTDMCDIGRFRDLPYGENLHFYESIFTPNECVYCLSYEDPYPHFAVRFAAKEAVIKALPDKLSRKDIEIFHKEEKPCVRILGKDRDDIRLSLSHAETYALSFAVTMK